MRGTVVSDDISVVVSVGVLFSVLLIVVRPCYVKVRFGVCVMV